METDIRTQGMENRERRYCKDGEEGHYRERNEEQRVVRGREVYVVEEKGFR